MDLITAQIAQLQAQAADQAALIQSQATSMLQLSSTVARISSENVSKDVFIRQLEAKVFPTGFWVWERLSEGGETGRWVWSKDTHRNLPVLVSSRPPASFDFLPDEIIDQILLAFRYEPPTLARLCRTSRRLLQVVLKKFYERLGLSIKATASFLTSRLSTDLPKSPQISTLLSPINVHLYSPSFRPDFSPFDSLPLNQPPFLNVDSLSVNLQMNLSRLHQWDLALRLFNPKQFRITTSSGAHFPVLPSISNDPVALTAIPSFTAAWERLEEVVFEGETSVLLLPETTSPFEGCLGAGEEEDEIEVGAKWTLRVIRDTGAIKEVEGDLITLLEVEGLLDYTDTSVTLHLKLERVGESR